MEGEFAPGLYEVLLNEEIQDVFEQHPELRSVFGKLDPEEEPSRYAAFISKVIEQALRQETESTRRLELCNRLIALLGGGEKTGNLATKKLLPAEKSLLLEITPSHYARPGMPRPETPLAESSLFTGSPHDPQLVQDNSSGLD